MTGDTMRDGGAIILSDNDRAQLEKGSCIKPEVIAARGYATIQDKRDWPKYGFNAQNGRVTALVVPLHSANGETIIYQIRPHNTPTDANGKQTKYLFPHGGRLVIDVNPCTRQKVLNADVELWIVEGAKKADAGISRGLACVSISGVFSWRNNNGPLPCWESIPLRGRLLVLAFDSDFRTNPRVYRALTRFANWLRSKGAIVRFCLLPEGKDGQKVGLDDFLAEGGTIPELRKLLADELPPLSLESKLAGFQMTDAGNAERLAMRFGEDLRYSHTWKCWLIWNGQYWQRDETGQAIEYAKKTVRLMLAEAAATSDDTLRSALVAGSKKSESRDRLKAMLELAQSLPEIGTTADQFDADEWLLNVANGTLNLQTGTLQEFDREDYLTRLTPVVYDTEAQCPIWDGFLHTVLPDAEVRAFLQRAVGYSLTGSIREHVLLFLYGIGRNGKTTFLNVVYKLLTGYSCRLRADVLMQDRNTPNKGATPEIAALRGVRFAAVSELNDGQKLDEGLIKSLTGGDTITARPLYQKPESFQPTHKLWFAGNHRPVIRGTDEGVWRRPKLIPFNVIIPPAQRDSRLPEKLDAELPGILAWAVKGCLRWQRDGLNPPASVEAATQEYRAEMDTLTPFLDDCCVLTPRAQVTKAALWKAYEIWAEENGDRAYHTSRTLNAAVKARGGISTCFIGTGRAKAWRGIGLTSEGARLPEPEDEPETDRTDRTDPISETSLRERIL